MVKIVTPIDNDINAELFAKEVHELYTRNNFGPASQISLQSVTGDDDWSCSVGRIKDCAHPEHFYRTVNKSLAGSYIEACINRYPDYYRWRILLLESRSTYSIHSDAIYENKYNLRLHIPVVTNPKSFLCFYDKYPVSGEDMIVRYEHLECGKSYCVNTSGLHAAINHGQELRIHLVGVKYEDLNNWSH